MSGETAYNDSYKIYPIDYDGDGKTDLCVIDDSGMNIFTFHKRGSSYACSKIKTATNINNTTLKNREVYLGEFNGDGKTDFLVSPTKGTSSSSWSIYLSRGDGTFETKSITLDTTNNMKDIILQDIDSDGQSDVLFRYGTSLVSTFFIKEGVVTKRVNTNVTQDFKLIPTNINSRNFYNKAICIFKTGKVTRLGVMGNCVTERLVTGVVSSFGVINKIAYTPINDYSSYTQGGGAVFPYFNYNGGLMVVGRVLNYYKGTLNNDVSYQYKNAVIHKQGLGFTGFEQIKSTNLKTLDYCQRDYLPYNYSVLAKEETNKGSETYTYSHTLNGKLRKTVISKKVSHDKVRNFSVTSSYTYDSFSNPTKETIDYGNETKTVIDYTYENRTAIEKYRLGVLKEKKQTDTRDGSSYVTKETLVYNDSGLPTEINYILPGGTYKKEKFEYDSKNNLSLHRVNHYSSDKNFDTKFSYDTFGRITKETNPLGHTTEYTYEARGFVEKETDHKGNVTTYEYNDFDIHTEIRYPDGTIKKIGHIWIANDPENVYYRLESQTNQPDIRTNFNAYGKALRKGSKRFDGEFVYVDYKYDSKGRVSKESVPFKGSSATLWNTYDYDSYDRLISLKHSSGKTDSYSYNGLKETSVIDGVTTTKTYDATGFLIKSEDAGGIVSYYYRPDGQLSYVESNNIKTTFTYDSYGRRTAIKDPSAGQHQYKYDTSGNIIQITLPTGKTNMMEYDGYNRLIKKKFTGDFSTDYSYDDDGNLEKIESSNGMKVVYKYDNFGRIINRHEIINNHALTKAYAYKEGNLYDIAYYSGKVNSQPIIGRERYFYTNGNLTKIVFNTADNLMKDIPLWELQQERIGLPQKVTANKLQRYYYYNNEGQQTKLTFINSRKSVTHGYSYDKNGSLINRTDYAYEREEKFEYDNLDRLIKTTNGVTGTKGKEYTVSYDKYGNRTKHSGIGIYTYNGSSPYTLTNATCYESSPVIPDENRETMYNSLNMPSFIFQGDYQAAFEYKHNKERGYMVLQKKTAGVIKPVFTRLYFDNNFEMDIENNVIQKQRLYLGGDYYSAPAVYIKENNVWNLYHIFRDHLGSIVEIMDNTDSNNTVATYSYDPWGMLRNPATHEVYNPGQEPELMLGRGYTGHEHLPWFGIINMNARFYDPVLGRFLSPDPYVQAPDFTQNFNRYSYCLNNPLRYVDTNGEFFFSALLGPLGAIIDAACWGAVINGGIYTTSTAISSGGFNNWNWGQFGRSLGVGAISGAAGAGAGLLTQSLQVYGALPGALVQGGIQGVGGGIAGGFGNVIMENNWKSFGSGFAQGFATGFISGGITGGIEGYQNAKSVGANRWTGKLYRNEITYSTPLKNGIPLQPDPSRDCYAYALEYADSGHGNNKAEYFLSKVGNVPGYDVQDAANLANIPIDGDLTGRVKVVSKYEAIGRKLASGKEVIGVMNKGGQGHAVNVTSITTATKLKIIGGGYNRVLKSTSIWDPISGHKTGPKSFLKIVTLY